MSSSRCAKCGGSTLPSEKFCAGCGASQQSQGVSSASTTCSSSVAANKLSLVLCALGALIFFSGAIGHSFTKFSCALSDGSAYDCGAGPTPYHHTLSALLFLAAAVVSYQAGVRRTKSAKTIAISGPLRKISISSLAVGALVLAGTQTISLESNRALMNTVVGQMTTVLTKAKVVPDLIGSVESLDNGGQQYFGNAPTRAGDILPVCTQFVRFSDMLHSLDHSAPGTANTEQVASCVTAMNKVLEPPVGGIYPVTDYTIQGWFVPRGESKRQKFLVLLGLSEGRGSNPTMPYPSGYRWSISINLR